MPPTPRNKLKLPTSTPNRAKKGTKRLASRDTLSELSQNINSAYRGIKKVCLMASVDGQEAVKITREVIDSLGRECKDAKEYISNNLEQSNFNLEIYGFSQGKYVPSSFYDNLFSTNLNVKQLTLRGRGLWNTCRCPPRKSMTEQIDTISPDKTTNIERLYIMRPFQIRACTLLDLIARSPNLKIVRFYGVLIDGEHHEAFDSVRFQCELERVYWPWCNRKRNLPTLKTLVKRNDTITTFYSNGDSTCDLLGSDLLPNLRYLSIILNESWVCKDNSIKRPNRYLKKIAYLSLAKKLEALEIRTFKLELEDYENEEIDATVWRLYENYQLSFWENVAKLPNLKFLAIYGAWELDNVARELARHGLQIEYLRTNLVPSSMIPAIDAGEDLLVLSMCDSIKELRKLTKLRSLHFACHENLANIDSKTVSALKELADLIWVFDLRIAFSPEVEDLITNILRRGNQQGKAFNIKLHVESNKSDHANCYVETIVKFSSSQAVRQQLISTVEQAAKEKFGKVAYKTFHLWGIEQAGSRDRSVYDKLSTAWNVYNDVFKPIDMFT